MLPIHCAVASYDSTVSGDDRVSVTEYTRGTSAMQPCRRSTTWTMPPMWKLFDSLADASGQHQPVEVLPLPDNPGLSEEEGVSGEPDVLPMEGPPRWYHFGGSNSASELDDEILAQSIRSVLLRSPP